MAAAAAGGLDIIALTDHDTVAGIPAALRAARELAAARETGAVDALGTTPVVVPGIEISSTHAGAEIHILGYFIDHRLPMLQDFSRAAAERRRQRMTGMIELLAELGVEIDYEEVLSAANGATLGRPHLAQVLVERGYVENTYEAFDRYLGDGGPAFLPTELLTPREAIELIHNAGGLSVWAHPPWEVLEKELDNFVEWGLQGLECYRPRNTATGTRRFLAAAEATDLLVTGGSDWHGDWHGPLGSFSLSRAQAEAFLEETGL